MPETSAPIATEAPAPSAAPPPSPEPAEPQGEGEGSSPAAVDDYAELARVAKAAAAQFRQDNPEPESEEETAAAGTTPAAAAPEVSEADDTPLARLLKSRERAAQKRGEADDYAARLRSEAESAAQAILRDAQERARRLEAEGEERIRRRLEEQLSPEALLAKQADAQDPQVQLRRWMEAELQKRDQELAKRDEALKAIHAVQEEQRSAGDSIRLRQAEQAFAASAKKDTHPALVALFTPAEIVAQGHALLAEARAEAKRQGMGDFSCSDAELLGMLETRARSRLLESKDALSSALQQVAGTSSGKAPPQGSKGSPPRTLSALASSERRATPRPSSELSESEMDKAMRAAAKAALRK